MACKSPGFLLQKFILQNLVYKGVRYSDYLHDIVHVLYSPTYP